MLPWLPYIADYTPTPSFSPDYIPDILTKPRKMRQCACEELAVCGSRAMRHVAPFLQNIHVRAYCIQFILYLFTSFSSLKRFGGPDVYVKSLFCSYFLYENNIRPINLD